MTEIEKAYIAGIIDAEGNITLQRFQVNEYPSPCISITSTTLNLLTHLKEIIGYGDIHYTKDYNIKNFKDFYIYKIKNSNAINLLKDIYPYLMVGIKKQRASLIINKYNDLNPNGHYTPDILKSRLEFYDEFINIIE